MLFPFYFISFCTRMAFTMAIRATPTSAKTASHRVASPPAPKASTNSLTPKASEMFCHTIRCLHLRYCRLLRFRHIPLLQLLQLQRITLPSFFSFCFSFLMSSFLLHFADWILRINSFILSITDAILNSFCKMHNQHSVNSV